MPGVIPGFLHLKMKKMKSMKRIISYSILVFLIFFVLDSCTQESIVSSSSDHSAVSKRAIILQKNFPFLNLVQSHPKIKSLISENESFKLLAKSKQQFLTENLTLENFNLFEVDSIASYFQISDVDMQASSAEWLELSETTLLAKVIDSLRTTNQFFLNNELSDQEFIQKAWQKELNGINHIISVYATGEKPRYPHIDSVSYNVRSDYYKKVLSITALNVLDDLDDILSFYESSLDFALWLLEANERNEAARFEPMELGENAAAVKQVAQTKWEEYPYSVILVPGHGPEEEGVALSPLGMMRCKLAADRYFKGLAPYIILSGGFVHPFQTPFCEAIEMKNELMNRYNIPESALIIEPHARHTTTNFRNAARLIFNYGIPSEKKALCTTTLDQSYYITNKNFDKRCIMELGYVPYKLGERLNRNDVEFYPLPESCMLDCNDPLDP